MRKMSRKTAQHLIWAFDKEKNARACLARAVDDVGCTKEERDRAWHDFKFYSKWRDDELRVATGMDWETFNNHAFGD